MVLKHCKFKDTGPFFFNTINQSTFYFKALNQIQTHLEVLVARETSRTNTSQPNYKSPSSDCCRTIDGMLQHSDSQLRLQGGARGKTKSSGAGSSTDVERIKRADTNQEVLLMQPSGFLTAC